MTAEAYAPVATTARVFVGGFAVPNDAPFAAAFEVTGNELVPPPPHPASDMLTRKAKIVLVVDKRKRR